MITAEHVKRASDLLALRMAAEVLERHGKRWLARRLRHLEERLLVREQL